MKWFTYTRGTIHPHRIDQALLGIYKYASKLNEARFDNAMYINIDSKMWFVWSDKEIRGVGNKIIEKCSVISKQKNHFKKLEKYIKKANKASKKVKRLNLKKLSNKEIINKYNVLTREVMPAHGLLDIDIDAIDIVFEEFLQNKIKKEIENINQNEFAKIYQGLTIPIYETYVSKEKKDLIKLALKSRITRDDIGKIYQKYWWTSLGWENVKPHNRNYFEKRLNNKLTKKNNRLKEIRKNRKELLMKYNFSKEIEYWLRFTDKYNKLHDLRKEMQVRAIYSYYLLMSEVARRLKLNKDDLEWLFYDEIKDLLRGGRLNKSEIKKRKKAICVRISKDGIKAYSGQKAIEKYEKEIKADKKKVKEIKGMGVSSGKVVAKVKVCSGVQDALKKIQKGDILVCGMTLPDYVPAMKKASAIITDEGGITCHAAIISRELDIPCVVGTRIATEVLKDGDRVEVDVDRGTVKKIS